MISLLLLIALLNLGACETQKEKVSSPDDGNPPENAVVETTKFTMPGQREIPYEIGREYIYTLYMFENEIGSATLKLDKDENNNYRLFTSIDSFDEEFNNKMKGASVYIFDDNWNPISYERELDASFGTNSSIDGHYSIKIEFENNIASIQHQKPGDTTPTSYIKEIPEDVFLFEDNFIGQMALICSQPHFKTGRTETLTVFSISFQSAYNLTMTPRIKHELPFDDEKIIAYEIDMKVGDATFGHYYVTRDGLMVMAKEEGGRLVIILEKPE